MIVFQKRNQILLLHGKKKQLNLTHISEISSLYLCAKDKVPECLLGFHVGKQKQEERDGQVRLQMCDGSRHGDFHPCKLQLEVMLGSPGHTSTLPGKSEFRYIPGEGSGQKLYQISAQPDWDIWKSFC